MALKSFGREPFNLPNIRLPRGQDFLIPSRCKGCGICSEFCPLEILTAISELSLEEMAHGDGDTLCCRAGDCRMWMDTDPGMRFADIRVHDAKNTDAESIATACPFCLTCLEDSVKGDRTININVKDGAEFVASACRG